MGLEARVGEDSMPKYRNCVVFTTFGLCASTLYCASFSPSPSLPRVELDRKPTQVFSL
jgi:hypothetical protein